MLAYEDGPAAMDWLAAVFGLTEQARMIDDGRLSHGELELDGQTIMLATPSPNYQSPKTVRHSYPPAAKWSEVPYIIDGVLISVPDLDGVYKRAREMGGVILSEIEEGFPGRRFRLEDPEGHRWYVFARE